MNPRFIPWYLLLLAMLPWGCDEARDPAPPRPPDNVPISVPAAQPSDVPVATDLLRLPGMDCLLTRDGLRVKAITTRTGLRCTTEPAGGRDVEPPLTFFMPYYVLDSRQVGNVEYYLLADSPRKDAAIGWLATSQLVRWDTRVGGRYMGVSGGPRVPPLLVYRDKSALLELIKTGTTAQEPIARAMPSSVRKYMPWPVIAVEREEVNGEVYEIEQIAFLGQVPSGGDLAAQPAGGDSPALTEEQYRALKGQARFLEVVFVIDSTGSMDPWINATRDTVNDLAGKLATLEFKPELRLGLVAFQDYLDSKFVTKPFAPTADPKVFAGNLNSLTAEGGGDDPEAVWDGVLAGLKTRWQSPYSRRVLILVGDASAHEPGDKQNPNNISREQLIEKARADGVTLFGLAVGGRGGTPDKELRWKQFTALAQGTGGECFEIEQANAVLERVRLIMNTQTAKLHLQSEVIDELRKGQDAGEIAHSLQADPRQVTEVMQFLQLRGLDPARIRADGIGFATGWVLPEFRGTEIVQRECLLSRGEMDLMLASLNTFSGYLGSDLAGRLAFSSLMDRTNPLADFFKDPSGQEPFDVFLQARGVPVGRTSILRLSKDQVLHMPEERRAVLRAEIAKTFVPALTNWRNDDSVWRRRDADDWTWCPENLLP